MSVSTHSQDPVQVSYSLLPIQNPTQFYINRLGNVVFGLLSKNRDKLRIAVPQTLLPAVVTA